MSEKKFKGRAPDYNVRFVNKATQEKGTLGHAWKNDDGSITIRLNPKVVLAQNSSEIVRLFAHGGWEGKKSKPKSLKPRMFDKDDDVPF